MWTALFSPNQFLYFHRNSVKELNLLEGSSFGVFCTISAPSSSSQRPHTASIQHQHSTIPRTSAQRKFQVPSERSTLKLQRVQRLIPSGSLVLRTHTSLQ
uniref:Uncharacterized protein n=1 Tax=Sphaerodactylus townsendi TaxID=933632 RepID=A0ACB8ET83_9SAUR